MGHLVGWPHNSLGQKNLPQCEQQNILFLFLIFKCWEVCSTLPMPNCNLGGLSCLRLIPQRVISLPEVSSGPHQRAWTFSAAGFIIIILYILLALYYVFLHYSVICELIFVYIHLGENQTSAENVGCSLYHDSVVNCSWDFGKKAPKDTIYSLRLYQSNTWEECQDYKTDLAARQMHCSFKVLKIQYKQRAYLVVEGSSNTTPILFYDQWINLCENEILMPPRNILINASTHGVEIKWEKPETHTYYSDHCFKYEITLKEEKMQDKTYNVDKKLHFTVHEFTSNQQFQLKVRAKRNFGCSDTKWSTWSETSKFVPSAGPLTHTHLFILLAIGTVIAVTALIYVCHRFQVLKKVFPPIPAPVIKLQSLDQDELKELQENLTSASEKLPDNEDIKICEIDNYAEDIYFEKIFK
uniref:Granulocyte-macrophage colony-stimulating factor receptor subunit alpha n=1 Tax=Xenopus tropicalis TaxID=8364 RepID=A0A803JRR2_XENTR